MHLGGDSATVRPGNAGQERRMKTNAKGMIVFPGELRMYHQQHLTWRKRLKKVNQARKTNSHQPFAVVD